MGLSSLESASNFLLLLLLLLLLGVKWVIEVLTQGNKITQSLSPKSYSIFSMKFFFFISENYSLLRLSDSLTNLILVILVSNLKMFFKFRLNLFQNSWTNLQNITDINFLYVSYQLVKHFLDFPLLEYTIASFNQKLLLKGSNCSSQGGKS